MKDLMDHANHVHKSSSFTMGETIYINNDSRIVNEE
jgi:hypothetical protein